MTENVLPANVLDLVQRALPTMEHVELLLLLAGDEARGWTAMEASAQLQSAVASAAGRLDDLERAGLVRSDGGGDDRRFWFAPATESARRAVEALEIMYRQRPVTLVRAIYERPPSAIRSFADSFRLRGSDH